jgi:hypothetical protein
MKFHATVVFEFNAARRFRRRLTRFARLVAAKLVSEPSHLS